MLEKTGFWVCSAWGFGKQEYGIQIARTVATSQVSWWNIIIASNNILLPSRLVFSPRTGTWSSVSHILVQIAYAEGVIDAICPWELGQAKELAYS